MGVSESINLLGDPNWHLLEQRKGYSLVMNNNTNQIGEHHTIQVSCLQQELEVYSWRRHQSSMPIVGIHNVSISNEKQSICKDNILMRIITEHPEFRLSDVQPLNNERLLSVMNKCLVGFKFLTSKFGFFRISPTMIGISHLDQVKVWVNSNFALNWPQHEIASVGQGIPSNKLQSFMIDQLMSELRLKTANPQTIDLFKQRLIKQNSNQFDSVIRLLFDYNRDSRTYVHNTVPLGQRGSRIYRQPKVSREIVKVPIVEQKVPHYQEPRQRLSNYQSPKHAHQVTTRQFHPRPQQAFQQHARTHLKQKVSPQFKHHTSPQIQVRASRRRTHNIIQQNQQIPKSTVRPQLKKMLARIKSQQHGLDHHQTIHKASGLNRVRSLTNFFVEKPQSTNVVHTSPKHILSHHMYKPNQPSNTKPSITSFFRSQHQFSPLTRQRKNSLFDQQFGLRTLSSNVNGPVLVTIDDDSQNTNTSRQETPDDYVQIVGV